MDICILCFLSVVLRIVQALSSTSLREYCSDPDRIGVVGGVHNRLVAEGGHITLTCCVPGTTNGHDHEQLVWLDARGSELTNHFANPHSQSQHGAYSVPDFRSFNHLVSTLVIPKFRADDAGEYTCRKPSEDSTPEAAVITLDLRPRLLADYMPLAPTSVRESEAAVVAGRPVFVALEEGREGELECRINPNLTVDDVHLTWYFQGRQLIAPASAIVGSRFHQPYDTELPSSESELEQYMNEHQPAEESKTYGLLSGACPLSVDPSELGIRLLESGQVLQIRQVGDRHAGTYLCKAEALNPDWSFQPARYGKPAAPRRSSSCATPRPPRC